MTKRYSTLLFCVVLVLLAKPALAEPPSCSTTTNGVGSISRWLSGDAKDPLMEHILYQSGPITINRSVSVFEGQVETWFNVYYGFTYAAELDELIDISNEDNFYTTLTDNTANSKLLTDIRDKLLEKKPALVAAMDQLWEDPTPGESQTYEWFAESVTTKIVEHKTLHDFPDTDGRTDTIAVETTYSDGSTEKTYFSTEYCTDVGFEYTYDGVEDQDDLIGFMTLQQRRELAELPSTPKQLIEKAGIAMQYLDFESLTQLTHPESLERLKDLIIATYEQGKVSEMNQFGLNIGEAMTLEKVRALSASEVYTRIMTYLASNSILAEYLMKSEFKYLDMVEDDNGEVLAVVKANVTLRDNNTEVTDTMPIMKTRNGRWAVSVNESLQDATFRNIGVEMK